MDLLNRNASQHRLGMILAFGSLLWAGTYNALAKGLTPFLSPMSLLVLSEALTAVFIVFTFGLVPLVREGAKLSRRAILMSMLIGVFNSVLAPLFWFAGLARTSAGNASLLSSVEMLCVLLLGGLLLKERITRMQAIGAGVVLFGVMVINFSSGAAPTAVHWGDLLVVTGSLISGTGAVLFKKYLSDVMPEVSILIRNLSAVFVAIIAGLLFDHWLVAEVQAFPIEKILLLVAFTFFSRYLNLTFFYEALDRLPATSMSLIEIAGPLSGLLFAHLILGETVTDAQILGGVFIVFGLLLEQVSKQAISDMRHHSIFTRIFGIRKQQSSVGLLPKNA